jgi:outer membrane lipoprotein-sorting protein
VCCLVVCTPSLIIAEEPAEKELSAQRILERIRDVYKRSHSYRDTGAVKTVFIKTSGNETVEKRFTTAFIRPDRFRFEYKERRDEKRDSRYIVWCKGKDVQTWWDWDLEPLIEKDKSLRLALAGATGVSSGAAHNIPALLLPKKIGGRLLTDLTDVKRIGDMKLGKTECFRVEGEAGGSPTTLWIDRKSFVVRRIDEQQEFDSFRTERTTTYEPVIDGEIADGLLEFGAPEQQ